MEPLHYGRLGTNKKCPDYQGVWSVYMIKHHITKCVDYEVILICKCPALYATRNPCSYYN